jgi:hypothetical protein
MAIRLPTDSLLEGWQDILCRLDQADEWRTLELCVDMPMPGPRR